jgi:hypothetical protein
LNLDSGQQADSYSRVFRDGRVEAVRSAITFLRNCSHFQADQQPLNVPRYLHDAICERAVFKLVEEYLSFCNSMGVRPPITMCSALVGCKGVLFDSELGYRNSKGGIDRSPAFLPDIEIASLDADTIKLLHPWCDTLLQSCGLERSPNWDEAGNWRERRR